VRILDLEIRPVPVGPVVVHCSSPLPDQPVPPERLAGLAILLRSRGYPVVIAGDAGDRDNLERVAAAARVSLAPADEALGPLILDAALLVTNDSHAMRIARIARVRAVRMSRLDSLPDLARACDAALGLVEFQPLAHGA
jgi:ADP-heptose:LPS heptosyltransferase